MLQSRRKIRMHLVKLQQRTKSWLEWRKTKIMASDAPIITGASKFKTVQELYNEKIKCYECTPNPYMKRGIDLEPVALKEFEKETGLIMFPVVGMHDKEDWMAASFDGMTIEEDLIVEIKCPGKKDHNEAILGMIPDKYFPQIQHQIYVSGLDFAYYYSFDGEKGIVLEVKRDEEFIEKMIAKEKEFWHCLQALQPPTPISEAKKHKNAITTVSSNC